MRPLNLLYPLTLIYRFIIFLRNNFYDLGLFKIEKVKSKVISVGNITAGGSGKTPFVIFLAKLLQNEGKQAVILSRGYGRKSKGWVLVHDGSSLQTDIYTGGDEPVMTALELNNIPVAVCEDRVLGAKKIIKQFDPDYIILDDAFQHRRIHRDIDIVLLPANINFLKEPLIPAGYLREPLSNLRRGDIFILTKGDNTKYKELQKALSSKTYLPDNSTIINSTVEKDGIYINQQSSLIPCSHIPENILGITAIAAPEHFFQSCKKASIIIKEKITYLDHHYFTGQNIDKWQTILEKKKLSGIIMTMKDYVKLHHLLPNLQDKIEIYVLKIKISILEEDILHLKNIILSHTKIFHK